MSGIDVGQIGSMMSRAFIESLGKSVPAIREYAATEFANIAAWMRTLEEQTKSGGVSQEQARALLALQTQATRNVFLTIEGLELLSVERAINAAIDSVRGIVNAAIGFAIL